MKKSMGSMDVNTVMKIWIMHGGMHKNRCCFGCVLKTIERSNSLSERGEIKRDGAKGQKNSGRGDYQKGDAIWHDFVVDYKEYSKSISINKEIWAKICTDTFKVSRDKYPVLKLILGEEGTKTRLAVIEWALFEQMEEAWRNSQQS
jgi:hypothetical protein